VVYPATLEIVMSEITSDYFIMFLIHLWSLWLVPQYL